MQFYVDDRREVKHNKASCEGRSRSPDNSNLMCPSIEVGFATHYMMSDKQKWEEILREIEKLCDLHGDAICNFERCREFGNRLSIFLVKLEEMKCYPLADRVMDALGCCSPRIASHCENARVVKSILERMKDKVRERFSE